VEKIVYTIEGISVWLGRAFGWCILILTLAVAYEVFVRYVLNSPTVWSLDMQIQMYGALFLMTGPYALAQGAHVRGDFLYRLYPVKWQATSDLIGKKYHSTALRVFKFTILRHLFQSLAFSCFCKASQKCCAAGKQLKPVFGCHVFQM